jgi:hypothetical protein
MRPAALRKYAGDIRSAARFGFSMASNNEVPVQCFEDGLAPLVARLLEEEADRMEQEQCCQRALSPGLDAAIGEELSHGPAAIAVSEHHEGTPDWTDEVRRERRTIMTDGH